MKQYSDDDYTQLLREMMRQVGVSSFLQLSRLSGVSVKQIRRLRQGNLSSMRLEILEKLAKILQVSVGELLVCFSREFASPSSTREEELKVLKQEYQRLQQQLELQRESLRQEFQEASLQVLESWLLQWPTAAYAVQNNNQLPAVRLLPLVRPVEQLLQGWGVEAIASVGAEIPYDPQQHQLMEGTAQAGEVVRVRYTGYRQGEKLLYRAKVSPVVRNS
ncbi:MAG: helix-turn-helix domain-containing protein [Coleofasciculaceae cyanobacterium]